MSSSSSAQDSILGNNFLLLLAALMQQQQQQQEQHQQHQHQQQQHYQQKHLLQQQQQMLQQQQQLRLFQQQQQMRFLQQQQHHLNLAQIQPVPLQHQHFQLIQQQPTNASTTPILSAPTPTGITTITKAINTSNSISPSTSPPQQQLSAAANTAINCPSSTLLAKLNAVTTRSNAQSVANTLDSKMIDLLEALYAINDNPEPAAIEMIARRVNVNIETLTDWFENKRLKLNPFAGPRSPPAKKREGGRVVTFSEYQRSLLEAIFDENNYLHPQEYEELSNLIQVPSRNIKIWFKNRRSKQRLSGRIAD